MKKLLVALAATLALSSAYADNNPVFVDLNLGYLSAPYDNASSGSAALNLNAGYMFNQYFGLEGDWTYSTINYDTWTVPLVGATFTPTGTYNALAIAAKGVLPLSDVFSLYGKAGLSYNWYTGSVAGVNWNTDSSGLLLGIGAKFNLTQQWSLHLEDNYTVLFSPNDSTGNAQGVNNPNVFMFGAEYRF